VRGSGGEIGVAGASEGAEVAIGWMSAIEREEWSAHVQRCGGEAIYEVGGSSKSISPIRRGHGVLEEQGASDIIGGAKHAFSFAIFLRSRGMTCGEKHLWQERKHESQRYQIHNHYRIART